MPLPPMQRKSPPHSCRCQVLQNREREEQDDISKSVSMRSFVCGCMDYRKNDGMRNRISSLSPRLGSYFFRSLCSRSIIFWTLYTVQSVVSRTISLIWFGEAPFSGLPYSQAANGLHHTTREFMRTCGYSISSLVLFICRNESLMDTSISMLPWPVTALYMVLNRRTSALCHLQRI